MRRRNLISILILVVFVNTCGAIDKTDESALRKIVYTEAQFTFVPTDVPSQTNIDIPEIVIKIFNKDPKGTVALLLKIVEGGSPLHSIRAVGYAVELLMGSGNVAVCLRAFEEKEYDQTDKFWKKTPLEHWRSKIDEQLAKDRIK